MIEEDDLSEHQECADRLREQMGANFTATRHAVTEKNTTDY